MARHSLSLQGAPRRRETDGGYAFPEGQVRRSFRWQLGFSYMRVTFVAVVALEALVLLLAAQSVLYSAARAHDKIAPTLASIAGRLLAGHARPEALQAYLDRPVRGREADRAIAFTMARPPQGWTVVTDISGSVWFDNRPAGAGPLDRRAGRLVEDVLRSGSARAGLEAFRTLRARPVRGPDDELVGVLLQVSALPQAAPGLVALAFGGLMLATIAVVSLGTVFGLSVSQPLTKRIGRLADAADAWSRGDLSRTVGDPAGDELGHLSRRLDRMAKEFDELLQARQLLATSEERARIARELHDSVKQQLFAASMRLGAARIVPPEETAAQLEAAGRLVDEAKNELSHLIHELRPVAIEGRELDDALRSLVARYDDGTGPHISLHVGASVRASPDVGAALYRIAQEAVSNALRHADPSGVAVQLAAHDGSLELIVSDDGPGFEPDEVDDGVGLASMRERAERLGGEVFIERQPAGGTRVRAVVPAGARESRDDAEPREVGAQEGAET